jgi:hypothetical protein
VRLLGLQPDNQALNLLWQLVGVAHRTAYRAQSPCSL